mgnify:CR=1 FL=1
MMVHLDVEVDDLDAAGAHARFPDRFFAQIVNRHLSRTRNRGGRVGSGRLSQRHATQGDESANRANVAKEVLAHMVHTIDAKSREMDGCQAVKNA